MNPHISYAMRNAEAVEALVFVNAPGALLDWSFLAIEFIVLIGFVTTVVHAFQHAKRSGTQSAPLTLVACLLYGLLMDISSYYTVENFWHGEFSILFLYYRLPLYIVLLYPALLYLICMTIRRYAFSPLVEAISIGFFGGVAYSIFDNLGPMLGWWIWDTSDPTTLPYLNSVPVTSYHWFFLFTGVFAWLTRIVCWDWVEGRKSRAAIGLGIALIPILTVVLGALLFVPYNLFAYNGMLGVAASLHALAFAAAGLTYVFSFRRPARPRDRLLMFFPLVWVAGLLYLYVAKLDIFFTLTPDGLSREGLAAGNLLVAGAAMVTTLAIVFASHPISMETAGAD
jgi:hypothetical protein